MIRADVDRVLAVAQSQVGYREQPRRSNRSKFGAWYGINPGAWCAMFVSWVFAQAGTPLPPISTSKGFSYTPAAVEWARRHGCWRPRGSYTPKAGDLCFYSFGGRRVDHVGIVIKAIPGGHQSVEGNTSGSDPRNGGMVDVVNRRSRIVGYIEVTPVSARPAPPPKPQPQPQLDTSEDDVGYLRINQPGHETHGRIYRTSGMWVEHMTPTVWRHEQFFRGAKAKDVTLEAFLVLVDGLGLHDVAKVRR